MTVTQRLAIYRLHWKSENVFRYSEGLCKSRHVTSTAVNATLLSSALTYDIPVINVETRIIETYGPVGTVQTVQEVAIDLPL
jgi:hypothetical protein